MGLAGPSKKRKISHDPNNTHWTRSEGFGHRILSSQGWTPGTVLGADPNNPHHTTASQVGIKVMLKDDNLGLGCRGVAEDTCTGLGDLQSLLGRLNGKSEDVVREEENTRNKILMQGRFGMRFVKGEVLESTWVMDGLKKAEKEDCDVDMKDDREEAEERLDAASKSESKRERKDKKKLEKEDKKKRGRKSEPESADGEEDSSSSSSSADRKAEKSKRKADKAAKKAEKLAKKERKEAKRTRKEEKRRLKAERKVLTSIIAKSTAPSSTASTPPIIPSQAISTSKLEKAKTSKSLPNSLPTSGNSTPITGRQALRSKWIAQKRMAVMDAKALNEILMIKAA